MTTPRPDRKRRGSPEWVRLGELLAARRAELGPDYEGHGGRVAFARDRLPPTREGNVNLKLAQDIELNGRENFTPKILRDVIAPAYEVTYESVRQALEGGSLEPAPGGGTRPVLSAVADPADVPVPEEEREAAQPFADEIHGRLLTAAARTGNPDPPGDEIFEPGSWDAQSWDRLRRQWPPLRRLWIIALAAIPDSGQPGRRHGSAAGLTSPEAALDRGNSAGDAA